MAKKSTDGPDYYALADGRQLWALELYTLVPLCKAGGFDHWQTHKILSACEHRFRMGAKDGEAETDAEAFDWWFDGMEKDASSSQYAFLKAIIAIIDDERRKVGR